MIDMLQHVIKIIIIFISILCLDAIFFYFIFPHLKTLTGQDFSLNIYGAFFTYLIMSIGIYYFIILQEKSIFEAFLLGFFTYSIYELTNYSTLEGWTIQMIITDTLWGGFVFSISSYITYYIIKHYLNKNE